MREAVLQFPLWLELSGLPRLLNTKIRSGAWCIFKTIVEIDCTQNSSPDVVEISVAELSERTGIDQKAVTRVIKRLKKEKVLSCFLPDSPEEKALLKIKMPLHTPVSADQIRRSYAGLFPPGRDFFRYVDQSVPEEVEARDQTLQQIVDLYFNTISLKMNTFILDELKLIRYRFPLESINRSFQRAKRNEIPSLHWVIKDLLREAQRGQKR
jgi:DNA-binding Lrp family transcriptional regulator